MKAAFIRMRTLCQDLLFGPQILAFLPAICLATYWLFGEGALLATALGFPALWALLGGFDRKRSEAIPPGQSLASASRASLQSRVLSVLQSGQDTEKSALFCLRLDDPEGFETRFGARAVSDVQEQVLQRLSAVLRSDDLVLNAGTLEWMIVLKPGARLDLEVAIQQASRFQTSIEEPLFVDRTALHLSACIGFALAPYAAKLDPDMMISQAQSALQYAAVQGAGSVRAYSEAITHKPSSAGLPRSGLSDAALLEHTVAWFQPQISTDTGQVCGFEALARVKHPDIGMISPADFLPQLEASGHLERLAEIMLQQSLAAMQHWDKSGLSIETVGVNFSDQDLSNPKFYDKIAWDLDRFDIAPHRLAIEVLESVIAGGSDDVIARNVKRLSELGCQIDLDDFGTGHASISSLRRLPIGRLKIDRSFVAKSDLDNEQQKMIATILIMADRLGISCLAEGVETVGEHAILAQLGCRYVQGFGIAKPMPLEDTVPWVSQYQAKLENAPQIGRKLS